MLGNLWRRLLQSPLAETILREFMRPHDPGDGSARLLKTWTDDEETRRVDLEVRENVYAPGNQLFSFVEWHLKLEDMSDIGQESFTDWQPVFSSGYYASEADAERDARRMIPWLQSAIVSD